jgi:alpha/beta superfamily hydrolase
MMRRLPTHLHRTTFPLLALSLLAPLALLSACASGAAATAPTAPTATRSATATATPESGTFYFTTDDHVTLSGKIVGTGTTAIVFSGMDGYPSMFWEPLATQLAGRNYLIMTYNYRGVAPSQGHYDTDALDHDLRGAIEAVRANGATQIVLIGAGAGSLVTAKVSTTAAPTAMVILSTPISWDGLTVSDAEMGAITAPKLFVGGKEDRPSSVASLQRLYDAAPQPKELLLYPGSHHGIDFFVASDTKANFLQRLFAFLDKHAPAK